MAAVDDLVSEADSCTDGVGAISDATHYSVRDGRYRAGKLASVWTDADNHMTKAVDGMFGFGHAPVGAVRASFWGKDQTGSNYATIAYDSAGNPIWVCRNDRQLFASTALATGTGQMLALGAGGQVFQITKPIITGSRGSNAAVTSLISQLAAAGILTDSTTA
jgi:hypothetical protein